MLGSGVECPQTPRGSRFLIVTSHPICGLVSAQYHLRIMILQVLVQGQSLAGSTVHSKYIHMQNKADGNLDGSQASI